MLRLLNRARARRRARARSLSVTAMNRSILGEEGKRSQCSDFFGSPRTRRERERGRARLVRLLGTGHW